MRTVRHVLPERRWISTWRRHRLRFEIAPTTNCPPERLRARLMLAP
jgi:hypothetical protein